MPFLKASIIFMGMGFEVTVCFSLGMIRYPGLAVVGEVGSNGVILYWLLLIMFLHLFFDISGVGWPECSELD